MGILNRIGGFGAAAPPGIVAVVVEVPAQLDYRGAVAPGMGYWMDLVGDNGSVVVDRTYGPHAFGGNLAMADIQTMVLVLVPAMVVR